MSHFVKDKLSFLWLAVGILLLLFANGMQIVPAAAWLAPVFLVRFLRTRKRAAVGLMIGYLANTAAFYVQWNAAFKDAGAMFSLYTGVFGLLVYLPYIADRLIAPRIRGFASSLVLPVAWVTVEFLLKLTLPLGTFFNVAYTQSTNLPLLQIMSVTGLWGVSFLVVWFAGAANFVWEGNFDVRRIGRGAAIYAGVLAAVLIFGGFRLAVFRPAGPTVQVSVLTTNLNYEPLPDAATDEYQRLVQGKLTTGEIGDISAKMDGINQDLFGRAIAQAQSGSKIVTFSEFNVQAFSSDEQKVLDEACAVARSGKIYLAFPFEVTEPDMGKRADPAIFQVNKSVMITPDGKIAYQYLKHNLLIGPELEHTQKGARQIQTIDTPYGRIASVICLDMEYPDFMRLAGRAGTDIVLSGAIDGTASTNGNPLHSIMASYRTIEEGFSLGRAGYYGQNVAVDYQGRVLGSANYYTAGDRTVTAHIPVKGVKTVYSVVGDFFPVLSMLALLAFAAAAVAGSRRIRKNSPQPADVAAAGDH